MPESPATAKPSHGADQSAAVPIPQPIPCYVIGLTDTPERWRSLITALASMGIVAQFWPAVDGRRSRPKLRPGERLRSDVANRIRGYSSLSNREIGCFLSHYRLLVHAYNTGHTRIAIFEDDAVPDKQLPNTLRAIAQLDASFGLVHLDATAQLDATFGLVHLNATAPHASYVLQLIEAHYAGFPLGNGIELWPGQVTGRDRLLGAYGLVLHRQTIALLLDRLIPLCRAYDIQLLRHSGIRAHYVFPPVAKISRMRSQIQAKLNSDIARQYNLGVRSVVLRIPLHCLWWVLEKSISYRHVYIWMYPQTFTGHIRTLFGLLFKKNWPTKIDSFWPTALARKKPVIPEPQRTADSRATRRQHSPQNIR